MSAPGPEASPHYRAAAPVAPTRVVADPMRARRWGSAALLAVFALAALGVVTVAGRGITLRCARAEAACDVTEDFTLFTMQRNVPLVSVRGLVSVASSGRGAPAYHLELVTSDGAITVTRPARGVDLDADVRRFGEFAAGASPAVAVDRDAEPDGASLVVGPLMAAVFVLAALSVLSFREARIALAGRTISVWHRGPSTLWRRRMLREWSLERVARVTVLRGVGRRGTDTVVLDAVDGESAPVWESCFSAHATRGAAALRAALEQAGGRVG